MSHFRPDTGWRRWSLVQVRWFSPAAGRAGAAGRPRCVCGALAEFRPHWVCPAQGCLRFPRLHCSGSRLLCMERALRCVRFQFSSIPQKCGIGWACVLCLSHRSSSGSRELAGRTLPGRGAPSPLRGPSLSFCARQSGAPCVCSRELASSRDPPGGCRPSGISGSLRLEPGGLFAVW